MCKDDLLKFSDHEEARITGLLTMEDPSTDRYARMMDMLRQLVWMKLDLVKDGPCGPEPEPTPTTAGVPEPEPAPTTAGVPEPMVDRAHLRTVLADAKLKGVVLGDLFGHFGVCKFSDVPDENLAELEQMCGEALAKLEATA